MIESLSLLYLSCDGCGKKFLPAMDDGEPGDIMDASRYEDWLVFEGINLHLCGYGDAIHLALACKLYGLLSDVWDRRQVLAFYPDAEPLFS